MDQDGPSSATFGEYTGALRRRWWVLVLGAVIGLGLAAAYLLVAPKTYISTATVEVNQIGTESDSSLEGARLNAGVNMDTEAQLVTSQAVSSRAKVKLQTTEIVGSWCNTLVWVYQPTPTCYGSALPITPQPALKKGRLLTQRRISRTDCSPLRTSSISKRMHCSDTSISWKTRRKMHHPTKKPDSKHRSMRSKPGLPCYKAPSTQAR